MPRDLAALTDRLVTLARKAGADAADAMAVEGTSISIDVRDGKLEQAERAEQIDLGLRVFLGRRQAIVSSSDARDETLVRLAERAFAMAREAPEDPCAGLAAPEDLARDTDTARLELSDPAPEPDPAALETEARRAEAAAREVAGVTRIDSASAGYGQRAVHLAASNGFSAGYLRSDRGLSCVAISGTGTGMERDYDYDSRVFAADLRSPEEIGRIAGERAVARQGARRPPTGTFPVLFDERIAGSLVGHLLQAISGSAIARGASWLRDALGKPVLPPGVSLIEEPHRPRLSASRLFDAEGLATARREIVVDGVLTGWTLDLGTARKLGLTSTANAARSPGGMPSPSVGNLRLTPGGDSPDALMAGMGRGLLVTSLIGATINPNTGDYSRGASGFWIEGGEIAWPVNECTIAGNLRDMLGRIVPSNDARDHASRVVPSILVEGMVVAGA
ncbi:MAG: TldD/PmbA family protein [Rubellimicrobium sp.]|nr:TldD/PmbA family protein [Rubellimicrobium sp.]